MTIMYVQVFIDIDQLKGKPMQHLVKIYYGVHGSILAFS